MASPKVVLPEIQLQGRKVLVTGAARGLGESFARALVAAGAQVTLADVLHERGRAVAAELGPQAHYVAMDLMDPVAIRAGVAAAAQAMGGLDGVLNAAGIVSQTGLSETSPDEFARVLAVNTTGTFLVVRAAERFLRAADRASVVNIASGVGLIPTGSSDPYALRRAVRRGVAFDGS